MSQNNDYDIDDEFVTQSRHHHRRPQKRKPFLSPLYLVIILEGLIIAALSIWIVLREHDLKDMSERIYIMGEGVDAKQAEIESLKFEVNQQANNAQDACLPKLINFKLDEFLEINKGVVKRAFFVLAGKNTDKIIEYKLILKNDSTMLQRPKFTLVFVNLAGNPIGEVKFGDGDVNKLLVLEKGEVKTIDGKYEIGNNPLPEIFTINILKE